MLSTSTFRDRRPEGTRSLPSSSSNVHREDEQPNEAINKRQRVRPPSIVPVSVPLPGRGHRARDSPASDSAATIQRSRRGWTQHAIRGNKTWRGARGGRGGRGMGQEFRGTPAHYKRYASMTSDRTSDTPSPRWNDGQYDHRQRTPMNYPLPMGYPTLGQYPYQTYPTRQLDVTSVLSQQLPGMNGGNMGLPSTSVDHSSEMTSTTAPGIHPYETSNSTLTNKTLAPPLPARPELETYNGESRGPVRPSAAPPSFPSDLMPPPKRRRLDHASSPHIKSEEIDDQIIPTHADRLLPPTIKSELRSPSPARRLIKESCTLYPLPDDCRKLNPNPNSEYLKNRNALAAKEREVLKRRGLKVEKVLFRDDGMVIEWTSSVPVWSDTLLPESPKSPEKAVPQRRPIPLPVPKSNASRRFRSRTSTTPASPKDLPRVLSDYVPLPGRRDRRLDGVRTDGSTRAMSISSAPSPPPSPKDKRKAKETEVPQRPAMCRPLPLPKPRPKPVAPIEPPTEHVHEAMSILNNEPSTSHDSVDMLQVNVDVVTHTWSIVELEDVEPMAVDYLRRYIRAFDTDPSSLRGAYAPYAVFSVRMPVDGSTANAGPSSRSFSPSEMCQGPDEIVDRLTLVGRYKFCPGRSVDIQFDVVSLGAAAGGGIFLTVYGGVVDTCDESRTDPASLGFLSVDQVFVLQKNSSWKRGGEEEGWPLLAVSHQMRFRETPGGQFVGVE